MEPPFLSADTQTNNERAALGLPPRPTEPPLLPGETGEPPRASRGLQVSTAIMGLLQLALAIPVSGQLAGSDIAQRLGYVVGAAVFWPLVVIGVVSVWPRHRNQRSRLIALIAVWGLISLGHLGNLGKPPPRLPVSSRAAKVTSGPVLAPQPVTALAPGPATWTYTPTLRQAYDLSPGSDKRLIKLIEGAREERYRSIMTEYAEACAARPADAVLALERVRFIEHFAFSEDATIESAEGDHTVAVENLTTRFPNAPGTVLYQLERKYGDELKEALKTQEHLIAKWNAADRAQFILMRAQAAGDEPQALADARASFGLNPTTEAGLLLARKALDAKATAEARQTLLHPVFDAAEPWTKLMKLRLLLKTGEAGPVVALLAELKASMPHFVPDEEIAGGLADLGRIAEAREVFEALVPNDWNRREVSLHRFQFELAHGTAEQAAAAYGQLRSAGPMADAFLRYRVALFLKHPGAGWALEDFMGGLLSLVFLAVLVGLPLGLIVPVHYWSLLREKKGKTGGWPESRWGLGSAWLVLAVLLVFSILPFWLMRPEVMHSWIDEKHPAALEANLPLVAMQGITWAGLVLCLGGLLWRSRAGRLLGPGEWTIGRAIGLGLGLMMVLRLGLGVYVTLWPQALEGELAAATSNASRLALQLREQTGAFGMLATLAVLVPVLEEFLFRGVLLQSLGRHIPFGWANATQATLFALVHENLQLFPFFFAFGYVAGELARRSKGLLPALVLHSANNALVCLLVLLGRH